MNLFISKSDRLLLMHKMKNFFLFSDEMLVILYLCFVLLASVTTGFKTGLEEGLICNVCVGTHPGKASLKFLLIIILLFTNYFF